MKLLYIVSVCMITGCMSMTKHEGIVRQVIAESVSQAMDKQYDKYIGSNCENFEQHYPEFKAAILGTIKK